MEEELLLRQGRVERWKMGRREKETMERTRGSESERRERREGCGREV